MTTPRQVHDLPSMRGGSPAILLARRPRRRRRLLVVGALLVLGALSLSAPSAPAGDPGTLAELSGLTRPEPPEAGEAMVAPQVTVADMPDPPPVPPFAAVGSLVLWLPSADVVAVGYHEASMPGALPLAPVGRAQRNDNATRVTLPPDQGVGPPYHVMSSRGRVHPPTSAVDIVMRDGDPVLAPVDGVVTDVRPYLLYGRHSDTRIEIQPDHAPDLRVVLIHVDGAAVQVGYRVAVGRSVLAASANRFPFSSHVDTYVGERWPHVHVEVKNG